jgi:hypothetical protein
MVEEDRMVGMRRLCMDYYYLIAVDSVLCEVGVIPCLYGKIVDWEEKHPWSDAYLELNSLKQLQLNYSKYIVVVLVVDNTE